MANSKRLIQKCPAGHSMDPNWIKCPYCEAEKRARSKKEYSRPNGTNQNKSNASSGKDKAEFRSKPRRDDRPLGNLRVFISSTSEDLTDEREAVFHAIQELGGYADNMLYWSADERQADQASVDRVKFCDLLILIVAYRYGSILEGQDKSITELEYSAAREAGIPVLAFFLDEKARWPPMHIQMDKLAQLQSFKNRVAEDVIYKPFRSPEDLKALVATSLATFTKRRSTEYAHDDRFNVRTEDVSPIGQLVTQPDSTVDIGFSEDGLPLILKIRRSSNISDSLKALKSEIARSGANLPDMMFQKFHQDIVQHSLGTWARDRIFEVKRKDANLERMFVTRANLGELFIPILETILRARKPNGERRRVRDDRVVDNRPPGTRVSTKVGATEGNYKEIESVGGLNRYLGLSLEDANVYSVGLKDRCWVEWRPFLFEDIRSNLADAEFQIISDTDQISGSIHELPQKLQNFGLREMSSNGELACQSYIIMPAQTIGELIMRIGKALVEYHLSNRIHGDLKPENVMLTVDGPVLVDDFGLPDGYMPPGWTPGWAAPEQILEEPVSFGADIYPLGLMVVHLLQGRLVGEVRKFKTPGLSGSNDDEFDIYYDPNVYVDQSIQIFSDRKHRKKWLSFASQCLKFHSEDRINTAKLFVERIKKLLDEYPLEGTITANLPTKSKLVAARFPGGREQVARLLQDTTVYQDEAV